MYDMLMSDDTKTKVWLAIIVLQELQIALID